MRSDIVLLFFVFPLCFYSCHQKSEPKAKVFHYNQSNYVTSLDPAFAKSQNNIWAVDHIFNQLIDLNDSLELIPELAKSWSINADRKIYTFHLRNDVDFQKDICFGKDSTRKFVAQDVVYSLNRLSDNKLNAPGSWVLANKLDSLHPFVVMDDSTFEIHLRQAFAPFLSLLTMQYCSIVAKEAISYYGENIREHPVGTGPFMLHKWLDRKGMFLKKNPHYFKHNLPLLDGVRLSFIEDRNIAFLEFLKNKIDFFSGIQSSFALEILNPDGNLKDKYNQQFKFLRQHYLNTEYIGINMEALPEGHILKNKQFRQALNYAIDKKALVRLMRFGIGTAAESGFVPVGMLSYDVQKNPGYAYDVNKAKLILQALDYANYKGGKELTVYCNKDYIDIITFVARAWQELGIQVKIEQMETATLREQMRNGKLAMFRASWVADYPDEESFLNVFYGKSPSPPNYTRFNNDAFDIMYDHALQETDENLRRGYYQKLDSIIIEQAPVIFLFYDQTSWFVQNAEQNFKSNALGLLKLEEVEE